MFVMVASISASVGCGFFARSAAAAMIWPDWQYPHCGTSSSIHARCTACARFLERPSIVVTRLPATAATGSTQVRVATPSRWTVQAPHWAMPQPNLVPVRPSVSRSTQRSGVSGVTLTVSRLPFTVKEIGDMTCFLYKGNGEQRAQASREREGGPCFPNETTRGMFPGEDRDRTVATPHHLRPPPRPLLRHHGRDGRDHRVGCVSRAADRRGPRGQRRPHARRVGGGRGDCAGRGVLLRRTGGAAASGGGRLCLSTRGVRTASGVSLWMGAVARDRDGRYGGRRRHVRELYRGAPGTVSRGDPAARYGRDRAALGRQLRRRQAGGSDPERLHDSETRRAGCPGRRGPVRVPSQPPPTSTVLGGGGDVVVALGAALVPVLFAYGGWQ